MAESELDFDRICRTCMCEADELQPLFVEKENNLDDARIDEMLMACTSIQVASGDGLPGTMCVVCTDSLKKCFSFKQQCEKSERSLREIQSKRLEDVKEEQPQSQVDVNNVLDDIGFDEESDNSQEDKYVPEPGEIEPKESDKCDFIEFLENNRQILTCRVCYKVFTSVEGLRCHKRLHLGGMLKCKICDKEYTRQNHLQRHEMTHHGKRKVHVCKICNKTLTRFEHLKRHLTIHLKEKPFTCTICSRGFNRQEHMLNHVKCCKGDRTYICDICNKAFKREDSLELHRHLHDNKQPVMPTIDNLHNIEEHYYQIDYDEGAHYSDNSENENDLEDCLEPQVNITENNCELPPEELEVTIGEDTNDKSEASEDREEKMRADTPNEGEMVETVMEDDDEADHLDSKPEKDENGDEILDNEDYLPDEENSTDSEYLPLPPKIKRGRGRPRIHPLKGRGKGRSRGRPSARMKSEPPDEDEEGDDSKAEFSCAYCDKIFYKLSALDMHKCRNAPSQVHKCEVCSKEFSRPNHLKRHMSSHSETKPFVCDICTKCFNRRDHLTQHMKLHSRAQEYECEECKRTFTRSDHLAKHRASKHGTGEKVIGEKKYKCAVCAKGFTTEKYRDVHMKGHAGEKRYQCKTCEKCFISKSHLSEHMKFHNDNSKKFLCSECGQRFIRNDYLVIHMRRHRGEKPFKCKFCGKGFPRTTDLTVHERYHTGEKTHLCTICGRGFGRAYNLTVHMRTHTGEKPYQCTYCDAAFAQGNDLKAHVRRHTGERFQCELCTETFLMGYLLTQHKRSVHGLNVVSNIRRLQPVSKLNQSGVDDSQPITIPLPVPVVPTSYMAAQIQAQISAVHHLQQPMD